MSVNPLDCSCVCHDGFEPNCNCCARQGETRPVDPAVIANKAALTQSAAPLAADATLYQQLLNTIGATDQIGAMRELARLHALDIATPPSSPGVVTDAIVEVACSAYAGKPMAEIFDPAGSTLREDMRRALEAADSADGALKFPAGLHPRTADLVRRFSVAMAEKLCAAQEKYGYSDGWADGDWLDECRAHLLQHVAKGDPRDVGNYAAFLWHHGASTAGISPPADARSADQSTYWGHKTRRMPDGSMRHEPLTRAEAEALWTDAERSATRRAELMPTEGAAVRHLAAAYERLKELGWREPCYCPKDGSHFRIVEPGISCFPVAYAEGEWPNTKWWSLSDDDIWPSRPILFKASLDCAVGATGGGK